MKNRRESAISIHLAIKRTERNSSLRNHHSLLPKNNSIKILDLPTFLLRNEKISRQGNFQHVPFKSSLVFRGEVGIDNEILTPEVRNVIYVSSSIWPSAFC